MNMKRMLMLVLALCLVLALAAPAMRERCSAIDVENRIRKQQGKKPKKYPRKPKTQVHKKGKKAVKNPTKLKKVL